MKATNFRVGNLIQDFECDPFIFEIEEIKRYIGYELWAYYRKGSIKSKEPDPIRLNYMYLLYFGFERVKPRRGTAGAYVKNGIKWKHF